MDRDRAYFLLLNIGHFLDHLFMLIFASVAALTLHELWAIDYADLLIYATPGFIAFGVFALPAGWLADRWSRDGMMVVFFFGAGVSSILASLAQTPLQLGAGLFVIGVFAAIYHPVGLAIVTTRWRNIGMRIAANGVWGNLGVACAALFTGLTIDLISWRAAFVIPGAVSILVGCAYLGLRWGDMRRGEHRGVQAAADPEAGAAGMRRRLLRISAIVFLTTALGSLIFQSTTFALPKFLDERLASAAADVFAGGETASLVGGVAFVIFAVASVAQLIVGMMLDRHGAKPVYVVVAVVQIVFFAAAAVVDDVFAAAAALGFMLGAFGQIPINDFMIGKMARGEMRARIYGVRFVVSFSVFAATLPLVAFVHGAWGFDALFLILAGAAAAILAAVAALPGATPATAAPADRP